MPKYTINVQRVDFIFQLIFSNFWIHCLSLQRSIRRPLSLVPGEIYLSYYTVAPCGLFHVQSEPSMPRWTNGSFYKRSDITVSKWMIAWQVLSARLCDSVVWGGDRQGKISPSFRIRKPTGRPNCQVNISFCSPGLWAFIMSAVGRGSSTKHVALVRWKRLFTYLRNGNQSISLDWPTARQHREQF